MNSSQLLPAARMTNSTINLSQWRSQQMEMESSLPGDSGMVLACILSFLAATISSAGGVGGGSLYVPILNIVAGLSLKTDTAFSTFMVIGGTLSNVLYTLFIRGPGPDGQPLIDYDIAVVSQPCLLLGVSVGVVCNVMFPEWLITALFAVFLSFATFKTYANGIRRWRGEMAVATRTPEGGSAGEGTEEALLGRRKGSSGRGFPWVDLVVLVAVWLCFFFMHLFIGGEGVEGAFNLKPRGVAYWLITAAQIPVAIIFTACIVHQKRKAKIQSSQVAELIISVKSKLDALPVYVFPVASLFTGVMSGLFGIGGGLLVNPVLLQIGVPPKLRYSVSDSYVYDSVLRLHVNMVQFIILEVHGIVGALVYAITCFVGSIVGLFLIEGAIRKSGRVSLIVLMVAAILALSAVLIASSGAVRVWAQYTSGQDMGFKLPC